MAGLGTCGGSAAARFVQSLKRATDQEKLQREPAA